MPALTGVWIVNTALRLTRASASSIVAPSSVSSRMRSTSMNAEWPSLRCQACGSILQRAQRADAADAKDHLLVQAHLAAAHVQDVGDRPVGRVVVGNVRVEQQQRHAADLGEPHRAPHRAAGHLDADRQRPAVVRRDARQRQPLGVVVGVGVLLVAVGIDRLSEVAVAVEKADADERDGHVAGGLEVVAGEHAQAARVDAERLVQAVLGAEVGDRAVELACRAGARTSGRRRSPCSGRTRRAASGTRP